MLGCKKLISITVLFHYLAGFALSNEERHPEMEMELFLELMVNTFPTRHIALVDYRASNYYLSLDDLKETPILIDQLGEIENTNAIAINTYPGVYVDYDESYQRLNIVVPADWLPEQHIGRSNNNKIEPKSDSGIVFNYDIYGAKAYNNSLNINTWSEVRVFNDHGIFSSTGGYSYNASSMNKSQNRYIRYDTSWQFSDEKKMRTMIVGDLITRPLSWNSSIRLGGIQASHNFSLRPDIITYPLPQFKGEVGLPSTVDLFVNGNNYHSEAIKPGPFAINEVSHLNGSGTATIVTTDALGRSVSIDIPFYVTPQLLRKGFIDYTISLGLIRQHFGIKNFSYTKLALDSSMRYGLSDEVTLEAHMELAPSLQVLGAGFVTNIGKLGVFNGAYMLTQHEGKIGNQIYLGYEYNNSAFNFLAKYTKRTKGYRDLATLGSNVRADRETFQLAFSKPFESIGNMSIGFFSTQSTNLSRDNVISLGWGNSFGELGNISAYANKYIGNGSERWSASVQWIIPLDPKYGSLSASSSSSHNNNQRLLLNYNKAAPDDGGFGGRLSYDFNVRAHDYYNTYLQWKSNQMDIEGGIYGSNDDRTYWGSTSGSIVIMNRQVFASKQINNSFALVSVSDMPDIPIIYGNKTIGTTNDEGYFLLSKVPDYYNIKVGIDPLNIPESYRAEEIEKVVAIREKSGYIVDFNVKETNSAVFTLMSQNSEHLPLGSLVILDDQDFYVGWGGQVYIENLQESNLLNVYLPNGESCEVELLYDRTDNEEALSDLGEYICL